MAGFDLGGALEAAWPLAGCPVVFLTHAPDVHGVGCFEARMVHRVSWLVPNLLV